MTETALPCSESHNLDCLPQGHGADRAQSQPDLLVSRIELFQEPSVIVGYFVPYLKLLFAKSS